MKRKLMKSRGGGGGKEEEARNRFSISAEDENMHILIHIPIKTRRATSMGRCKALPLPV